MSTLRNLSLTIAVLMLTSATHPETKSKLKNFEWMLGKWEMKMFGAKMIEEWNKVNDSTYSGSIYILKRGGYKKITGTMELICRNNEFHYMPDVKNKGDGRKITFQVVAGDIRSFSAYNPAQDFPQRINYKANREDELYTDAEGMKNGKFKIDEYVMKKVE